MAGFGSILSSPNPKFVHYTGVDTNHLGKFSYEVFGKEYLTIYQNSENYNLQLQSQLTWS